MAGSLNHIIGKDGSFRMHLIENMGDAHEALEECFNLIVFLSDGDMGKISHACKSIGYPDPYENKYGDDKKEPMKPINQ